MIHSSGITPYRMASEEIKSEPNIQAETVATSKVIDGKSTQYNKKNKQEEDHQLNQEKIIKLIDEFNKKIQSYDKRLEYSIHDKTNRLLVKVIDAQTDKVIKEIPDEKLMDMMADFCETVGILIDEKI